MKQLLLITFLLILFSCKEEDVNVQITSDFDPVAHFTFYGSASDISKYSNNGIVFNAKLHTDSFGRADSCYQFNGNSYIKIYDNDILDIKTNTLTISAWINPSKPDTTYIVHKSTNVSPHYGLMNGGGPYSLDIWPGKARALIYGQGSNVIVVGTTRIKVSEWQHLALTYDGNFVRIYYNGKLEGTEAFSDKIQVTNGNLHIGAYEWVFPSAAFQGLIDNVRIYNRSLTSDEILELYEYYK